MKLGLGYLKGGLSGRFIAAVDGGFDLLYERTHPAHPRAIDGGTLFGLTKPFLRRFMVRHLVLLKYREAALISAALASVNRAPAKK